MNYFYDKIELESGPALPGYKLRVVDSNGNEVAIYKDENGTNFDEVNRAIANKQGMAGFYYDAVIGQNLQVLDENDELIVTIPDFSYADAQSNLARLYAVSDTDTAIPGASDTSDRGSKYYADIASSSATTATTKAAEASSDADDIAAANEYRTGIARADLAGLNALAGPFSEGDSAAVYADGTASNNGIYSYTSSTWTKVADLPDSAAAASASLSQAWAEGTEPGGTGTKSAKEWSEESEAAIDEVIDRTYDPISGFLYGIVDQDDKIAFAIKKSGEVIAPATPAIVSSITQPTALSGMVWALLDQDGRIGIGLKENGDFVHKGKIVDISSVSETITAFSDALTPNTVIDCWGDSLTHGNTNGVTTPYPDALAALLPQRTIRNKGLSGRTSTQVATAFGSVPSMLTVTNNTIPASGAVSVTTTENGNFSSKADFGTINIDGELDGIAGTLAVQFNSTDPNLAGATTFTRTVSGTSKLIPNRAPFVPSTQNWENNTPVIWVGRNDILSQKTEPLIYTNDSILANIEAMIAFLAPLQKRFIVLTVTDAGAEYVGAANQADEDAFNNIIALNYEIMRRWPNNAIDIRKILVNSYDSGQPADVTAFGRDQVPPSLQIDGLHLNDAGYEIVANAVEDFITNKGW